MGSDAVLEGFFRNTVNNPLGAVALTGRTCSANRNGDRSKILRQFLTGFTPRPARFRSSPASGAGNPALKEEGAMRKMTGKRAFGFDTFSGLTRHSRPTSESTIA